MLFQSTSGSDRLRQIKYLSGAFFLLIALANCAFAVAQHNFSALDVGILIALSSPLLINRKRYYLAFGFIAGIFSLIAGIAYACSMATGTANDSPLFFAAGCAVFLLALLSALAMIFVGTHSAARGRFTLI